MAGYIGARSVTLNTTVATAQDVTATDTTPEVTIINNTHEDSDSGREGKVIFKGQQSGGEESTLAEIEANHHGSSDDEKANLIFRTNDGSDGASPTEAMRITSDQRLGINLTAPTAPLTVKSPANAEAIHVVGRSDDIGQMKFFEADHTTILSTLEARNSFVNFGSVANIPLQFMTNNSERSRIDNNGVFMVGKTASDGGVQGHEMRPTSFAAHTISGGTALVVRRLTNTGAVVTIQGDSGTVGTISIGSSSTSYNTSSDYRLKENVTDISDGITRVKQLAPKRFNFIADADTTVDGFLAHEAQAVVPEAVHGTKDEVDDDDNPVMQGIDQAKLVPLLTAALQEAIAKIETLETKVAALEAE